MKRELEAPGVVAADLCRESLYRFFAAVLRGPRSAGWGVVQEPENHDLVCEAADFIRSGASSFPSRLGLGEAPADTLTLRPLCAGLKRPATKLRADYDRVFGLTADRGCPPYETEYHTNAEAFFQAQQMADVAGFYRAFGLMPAQSEPDRPDYLPLELEFMAFVLMKKRLASVDLAGATADTDAASVCDEVQRAFFRDHLAWWVPAFASGLRRKSDDGIYGEVGRALAAWIPIERMRLDIPLPRVSLASVADNRPEDQLECAGCSG
jgi:TorA maturation chaperone TorD